MSTKTYILKEPDSKIGFVYPGDVYSGNVISPEWVAFQIKGFLSQQQTINPASVIITSSFPDGTKHTETLSAEVARQLWKQWVDKGYNRAA